ncbi:VOC family protein [Rufibacter glacialis]|uniref:VOC family protein n=1 Tax=Rufibacter glacialis TaxID=1259555 RepID=A0A5M8QB63_9BACT|nr:VOC family protein [Rufibacter glacialis]KAA6433235.1 VOC family protein [Rufibacter glacialis]GGK76238.1 VOC family protein [Rufibacter glacialis]
MPSLHPYLNFNGTTEEAFNFYKSVFGGEFVVLQRFKDTADGASLPAEDQEKIMHIALPIGEDTILMANDSLESMGHPLTVGNNVSLSIDAKSMEEATSLFNGLAEGGIITMPLQKTFWGAFFGMCTDRFGINWMVNHDIEEQHS